MINEEMAQGGDLPEDTPRRVQTKRGYRNAEQSHYGISATAKQRKGR